MSKAKNTSFIDIELPAIKSRNENKDSGIVDAGLGVRHIFVFLGKKNYQNFQMRFLKKICRIYWIC